MSVTEKTTHAAEARARLLGQFKGKTKIEGVVSAQAAQSQAEETVFFELLEERSLATGVGVQLDGIGEIVGEERKGKADALYRIYLQARILINRSSGTAPQINEIANLLIDAANNRAYSELYPAAFKIVVDDIFPTDVDAIKEILGDARGGGIRGFLEYTEADDDDTFTFADGDVIQDSVTQGFNAVAGTDFVTNGDFAAWAGGDPSNWTVVETLPNGEVSEVGAGAGHGGGGNGLCNLYSTAGVGVQIHQDIVVIPGANYTLSFLIDTYTDNSSGLNVIDILGAEFNEVYTTPGVKTINFTPTVSTIRLTIRRYTSSPLDVTIDNVSLTLPTGVGGVFADVKDLI